VSPLAVADIAINSESAATALPDAEALAQPSVRDASPDVRAANASVRAGVAGVSAAQRFRDPSLSLQFTDIRSNDQTSFSRLDTVQVSLTIPLSDGGLGSAQVREARAALAQAQAQTDTARRTVEANISAALLNARSARRQVQAVAAARDNAQVSYDKTVKGYTSGLFPLSDVLAAQAALRQARISYIQAIYDAAATAAVLENATGTGAVQPAGGTTAPNNPGVPPAINPPAQSTPTRNPSGTIPAPPNAPGGGTPTPGSQ